MPVHKTLYHSTFIYLSTHICEVITKRRQCINKINNIASGRLVTMIEGAHKYDAYATVTRLTNRVTVA